MVFIVTRAKEKSDAEKKIRDLTWGIGLKNWMVEWAEPKNPALKELLKTHKVDILYETGKEVIPDMTKKKLVEVAHG